MKNILSFALAGLALAFLGCSSSGQASGQTEGGAIQAGTGGASSTGGASVGTGGTSTTSASSGGARTTGGATGAGGNTSAGGAAPTGASVATGGATTTPSGGARTTGGANGTGGAAPSGGAVATGGATRSGGSSGSGPDAGSGGTIQTGGVSAKGGAVETGGASSTGGSSGGSSGTDGGANCGVDPVTPNATQQTRNALCYLYSIYGKKILAGQEENNDDNAMNYIVQNTGKSPAIRSFDVNNSLAPTQCVAQGKKGGLCMFGYHMGIVNGDGYASSQMKTDINTVLTEGSAYNTTFKARLDKTAAMIQTAQDGGAVAIMRLFHEAGGTWFWWSMETGAQYVRLWNYAFNYLTVTKGLRNMLWLLPYDGSPNKAFYPGKQVVDLGGADIYAGDGNYAPQTALYNSCVSVFGTTMPIALHECGPIPDPVQLQSTKTNWVFFSVWTAPYYQSPSNSVAHLTAVYTSDYVITLDEMPGF